MTAERVEGDSAFTRDLLRHVQDVPLIHPILRADGCRLCSSHFFSFREIIVTIMDLDITRYLNKNPRKRFFNDPTDAQSMVLLSHM